jgi:fructose-1,6-bisphosphatase I
MHQKHQTLGEFIIEHQSSFKYTSGELSRLINSIRLAAKVVNYEVNKAGLVDILGAVGDANVQGEDQQKLDVYANEKFIQTLINRNIVCGIAINCISTFIFTLNFKPQSYNLLKKIILILAIISQFYTLSAQESTDEQASPYIIDFAIGCNLSIKKRYAF